MTDRIDKSGLAVAAPLARFIDERVLPGTGIEADAFWAGAAGIFARFAPENAALLAKRDDLQLKIDVWHQARAGQPIDAPAYQDFLRQIGYLVDEPAPFAIEVDRVDAEVATMAGAAAGRADPQRALPAECGKRALGEPLRRALRHRCAGLAPRRVVAIMSHGGAQVVARAKAFLDEAVPLASGRWQTSPAVTRRWPIRCSWSAATATISSSATTACTSRS